MQSVQDLVINKYKRAFPKDTLKDVSKKTGIQVTRVFRLFNGSEMKVSELQSFKRSLNSKSLGKRDLLKQSVERYADYLSETHVTYLYNEINQLFKIQSFLSNSSERGIPCTL